MLKNLYFIISMPGIIVKTRKMTVTGRGLTGANLILFTQIQ